MDRSGLFRTTTMVMVLFLLLAGLMFLGIGAGSTGFQLQEVFATLMSPAAADEILKTIIWEIRFPRVVLAACVGAALSVSGLVFQALLRNPLAEPYILGISGGASVGAVLGMMLGLAFFPGVTLLSFAGSMSTLGLVTVLSSGRRLLRENSLLLAGVMVNAFCSAIIVFLLSISTHTKLQQALFWLMGDLSNTQRVHVLGLVVLLIPSLVLIGIFSKPMNLLQMGKDTASSLGVNVRAVSLTLLGVSSLLVSGTVCLVGLVGFVGLVIPHILRLIMGPDHRTLVPACILGGAAFMTGCDLLARTLPAQGEMPVGVVTALIGAPLFVYLLSRSS